MSIRYLVFDGDSLTRSGQTAGMAYIQQLQTLCGNALTMFNVAAGGETLAQMVAKGYEADALYDPTKTCGVVIWGGTNDFYLNGTSAEGVYDLLVRYCKERKAAGFKVIVLTMLPRSQSGANPAYIAAFEGKRQTFNALVRSYWQKFADGLVDVAADERIGLAGCELDTTYFTDKTHMTDAGYGIVASLVKVVIDNFGAGMKISLNTQTDADTIAARIHSWMQANNPAYAASVAAGKTLRWATPSVAGAKRELPIKVRCLGALTAAEQATVVAG